MFQQQAQAIAQQQAAKAQQEQMNADLAQLSQNPTPEAIGRLSLKYPQLSEHFKRSNDILSPAAQQAKLDNASQVYAAVLNNENGVAQDLLNRQATAFRNSGDENSAKAAETMASLIKDHPEYAKTTIGLKLASDMGSDKFTAAFTGLGTESRARQLQPAVVEKADADARKATADATVAGATVPQQIAKVDSDLLTAEQKRRLADFDAQISAADSETKRGQLTLERDKFVAEQGLKTQAVATDSQNQLDTIGNSIATVKSLRDDPLIGEWLGVGSTLGPFLSKIPGSRTKDFRAKVDTLKSQQFLTAAKEMKGMGALSDAEGARIERAVASLDPDQSPGAFKNALGIIQTTLERGEAKLRANGKVPTAGGAFVMKHPTYGNVTEGDLNRIIASRPGSTRQQAIDFLKSTGGQ